MQQARRWGLPVLAVSSLLLAPGLLTAQQRCDEPHYRWSVKTDTAVVYTRAAPVTISAILTQWPVPATGPDYACAPRSERERNAYVVRGWIRRIEKKKDDGDWHIELTGDPTTPTDSCIVVEIPLPALGSRFGRSRRQLTELLRGRRLDKQGDLDAPLEVRIVGAAFYDGQHRRTGRRDRTDGGHGRCNSSLRALWELHPVYAVLRP